MHEQERRVRKGRDRSTVGCLGCGPTLELCTSSVSGILSDNASSKWPGRRRKKENKEKGWVESTKLEGKPPLTLLNITHGRSAPPSRSLKYARGTLKRIAPARRDHPRRYGHIPLLGSSASLILLTSLLSVRAAYLPGTSEAKRFSPNAHKASHDAHGPRRLFWALAP